MSYLPYRKYVALGDSLTEGLGDDGFRKNRRDKGWADRLANLMACEAANSGQSFSYANLAVRGQNTLSILTCQLEIALDMQPDLVTIMTGANDLRSLNERLPSMVALLRGAVSRFQAIGTKVILVSLAQPAHLSFAKAFVHRSKIWAMTMQQLAAEMNVELVNVNQMSVFESLHYWAGDLVHYSAKGHIKIANAVAERLGLEVRDYSEPVEILERLSVMHMLKWSIVDVLPFIGRQLRGVNAGTGMEPKELILRELTREVEELELAAA
jgi:phosphatidylinositol alpha 1,6-mannosyltransferase